MAYLLIALCGKNYFHFFHFLYILHISQMLSEKAFFHFTLFHFISLFESSLL